MRAKLIINFLEKWRWLLLAIVGLSLLWVEIQEYRVLRVLNEGFHYFELVQYALLIFSTGILTELYARSNRAHKQAAKILKYKHELSLELTSRDNWESLVQKLTELPGKITPVVDEVYLLVRDPVSDRFERAGQWTAKDSSPALAIWDPTCPCQKCLEKTPSQSPALHECENTDHIAAGHVYTLGMFDRDIPDTFLKFRLKPAMRLTPDEEEIFNNIGDEIIFALRANQDRNRLSEMQFAEVAMAERRVVSSYVHDQLGQNLGFLHLKLDQLGLDDTVSRSTKIKKDLKNLQQVANESYEIVRDILKNIQPDTIPNLTNLLKQHARTVSRRAKFALNFKSVGKTVHPAPHIQKIIFFAFREILSNVEKHAKAEKVDVLVVWNDGFLDISVADNGKGFDPRLVERDEHFGLEIMQDRISGIKGNLVINSSTDAGTVVSLSIPLESTMAVPA